MLQNGLMQGKLQTSSDQKCQGMQRILCSAEENTRLSPSRTIEQIRKPNKKTPRCWSQSMQLGNIDLLRCSGITSYSRSHRIMERESRLVVAKGEQVEEGMEWEVEGSRCKLSMCRMDKQGPTV